MANELEAPPNSPTLLRTSSNISIEAMLQWPVFKQSLPDIDTVSRAGLGDNQFDPPDAAGTHLPEDMLRLEVLEPLLESFVANNLPCNPILDPVSLRQQVQAVAEKGLAWDGRSCLLVRAAPIGYG